MKRIRHIYIKAIATPDFKKHYEKNWQEVIKKTIQESSKVFEKEFGIKLVLEDVQMRTCNHEYPPFSIFGYANNLCRRNEITKYDVTVAFTNAPCFSDGSQESHTIPLALAVIFHSLKFILLSNPEKTKLWRDFYEWKSYKDIDWGSLKFLLIHELGHLFGAKDVKDKKSFMFEKVLTSKTRYFDEKNKKIILKNKWKQLPPKACL